MDLTSLTIIIVAIGIGLWILFLVLKGLRWLLAQGFKVVSVLATPLFDAIRRELARPSHFLYLILFGVGAIGSAKIVLRSLGSKDETVRALLFSSLWLFFSTNLLQQYLIYRTCIAAEVESSDIYQAYGGWWVGTLTERILRVIVVVLLLAVAGEIYHFSVGEFGSARAIASLNVCLFFVFIVWNSFALLKAGAADGGQALSAERRKNLRWTLVLDVFALALWLSFRWLRPMDTAVDASVVNLPSVDWPTVFLILTALCYAVAVITVHVLGQTPQRAVFLVLVSMFFFGYCLKCFYPATFDYVEKAVLTHGAGFSRSAAE